jgi:hypothetical protein
MNKASRHYAALLSTLTRTVGRDAARNELRWMNDALTAPRRTGLPALPSLADMVRRRADGEPVSTM